MEHCIETGANRLDIDIFHAIEEHVRYTDTAETKQNKNDMNGNRIEFAMQNVSKWFCYDVILLDKTGNAIITIEKNACQ